MTSGADRFALPPDLPEDDARAVVSALERYFLQESPHPHAWVLAGRIAAHRIARVDDAVLSLPMNGHRPRRWEPEPLRWAGINTGLVTTRLADSHERRTGRSSRLLEPLMRLF